MAKRKTAYNHGLSQGMLPDMPREELTLKLVPAAWDKFRPAEAQQRLIEAPVIAFGQKPRRNPAKRRKPYRPEIVRASRLYGKSPRQQYNALRRAGFSDARARSMSGLKRRPLTLWQAMARRILG